MTITALAISSAIGLGLYSTVGVSLINDILRNVFSGDRVIGTNQAVTVNRYGIVVGISDPIFDNTTALSNEPYVVTQLAPGLPASSLIQGVAPIIVQNNTATIRLDNPYTAATVSNPASITVDTHGLVTAYASGPAPVTNANALTYRNTTLDAALDANFVTIGPSLLPNGHAFTATNGILASIIPGSVSIGLTTTTVVPGSYSRADITVGSDGRLTAAASTPAPTSSNVPTTTGGSVQNALNANFMMVNPDVDIPGGYTFNPDFDIFIWSLTNSTYEFTFRPRPLINVSCAHSTLTTYDEYGLPDSCISGPVPGTPGGSATLDGSGHVPPEQLPAYLFSLVLIGTWHADTNTPPLFNGNCATNDSFYYIVSAAGNTTLGTHSSWAAGDWAICVNGTWDQIAISPERVVSFNGRQGVVVPQLGDYGASLIDMGGGYNLATLAGYGFVMWTASPGLPNGMLLSGTPGRITVSFATIDLVTLGSMPLADNFFPGFACDVHVDHYGRTTMVGTCNPLLNLIAGANMVLSGTQNVTVSLNQNIVLTSVNASSFLGVGDRSIVATGSGTATIPNVGTADFVMTEGAQTINGVKSFTSSPIVRSDQGVTLNNAANTFRQFLLPAPGLAADLTIRFPPSAGTSGFVLSTDGAGVTTWVANTAGSVTSVGATSPLSSTGGLTPVISISTTPTFQNVTAGTLLGTSQVCIGTTCLVSSGTASSLTMPATVPVANQVMYASSPTTLAFASVNSLIVGRVINRFFYSTADATLANVQVITSMFGTGVGSLTIPANTLQAGMVINYNLGGRVSSIAGGFTWSIALGGVQLGSCGPLTGAVTAVGFSVSGSVFIRSVAGVNMVVVSEGIMTRGTSLCVLTPVLPATLNPTIALALDVRIVFNGNNAANLLTSNLAYAEIT